MSGEKPRTLDTFNLKVYTEPHQLTLELKALYINVYKYRKSSFNCAFSSLQFPFEPLFFLWFQRDVPAEEQCKNINEETNWMKRKRTERERDETSKQTKIFNKNHHKINNANGKWKQTCAKTNWCFALMHDLKCNINTFQCSFYAYDIYVTMTTFYPQINVI